MAELDNSPPKHDFNADPDVRCENSDPARKSEREEYNHTTVSSDKKFRTPKDVAMIEALGFDGRRGQGHDVVDNNARRVTKIDISISKLTEKQKMEMGMPFEKIDPELIKERERCRELICRYNRNVIEPGNWTKPLCRQLLEKIFNGDSDTNELHQTERLRRILGTGVEIEPPFFCDYGYRLYIGNNVEIGPECRMEDAGAIKIGDKTMIGPRTTILTSNDPASVGISGKKGYGTAPVIIGEDVYIGAKVTILPGVNIKTGAYISSGTIVYKDVEEYQRICSCNEYRFNIDS